MKRITIKNIAEMLNLSPSTVSRALSDHPDISEQTKNRVRATAAEFNYTTNIYASLFRKKRSGIIALIISDVNMFYTHQIIKGVNEVINDSKNSLMIFLSNDSYAREEEIVRQCISWSVEGILISLSKETKNLDHLSLLKSTGIECVLYDKTLKNDQFPCVTINNEEASYQAVAHLIKHGHKNILGIFGNPNYQISKERESGYRKAMKEHNLPIVNENIISTDNVSNLEFILPPILNHNHKLTAIFTMTDELLSKSFSLARSLNKEIPKDLAIISISDGSYPYLAHPKITHIKDSGIEMGRRAGLFLLDKINKTGDFNLNQITLNTNLVNLSSV